MDTIGGAVKAGEIFLNAGGVWRGRMGGMSTPFHRGQREMQQRRQTEALADVLVQKFLRDMLNPKQQAFIASADMFFLATVDDQGRPACSYKGGEPGFVRVVDDRTLAIPNFDGDGKYLSWGNVLVNPNVALLFIDFMKGWRLRVHGMAQVCENDPLMAECAGAQFIVRVTVREVFGNCPRYIHKYQLIERSKYVPRAGEAAPVPDWKKVPEMNVALPPGDPAKGST